MKTILIYIKQNDHMVPILLIWLHQIDGMNPSIILFKYEALCYAIEKINVWRFAEVVVF